MVRMTSMAWAARRFGAAWAAWAALGAGWARAEVATYPGPAGIEASAQYQVEVTQGGRTQPSFVYVTAAQTELNRSKTTSWTDFSCSGSVTVKVTKRGGSFKRWAILPSSYGIRGRREGDSVVFELDRPRKVAVEFDGDITHPMLVFADPWETGAPAAGDPNTVYFGPGVHDVAGDIVLKANQTVYLAGGSYVRALIRGRDVPNVTIKGRGVLSGRQRGHGPNLVVVDGGRSTGLVIEGITLVDSSGYNITTQSAGAVVRNVKTIGWWFNTDGVMLGPDGLVEDCFLKCNDDAIKLYHSGNRVRDSVIWQMENGAPFQISWNMGGENRGFEVRNCDVIHVDHEWDNPNAGVFDAIHGGSGTMADYLFEDIRIENAGWRLMSLQIRPNIFSRAKTLGRISNITLRNVSIATPDGEGLKRRSVIQGYDEQSTIAGVTFENLRINGRLVRDAREGGFEIDPRTTRDVRFVATAAGEAAAAPAGPAARAAGGGVFRYQNPIVNGLSSYGVRDCHVFREGGRWYLTATENPNPEWGQRGVILYSSDDLLNWREEAFLIARRSLESSLRYVDEWLAPEVQAIGGRYYVVFGGRNEGGGPDEPQRCYLASAEQLSGPYRSVTGGLGRDPALLDDGGKVYVYWRRDQGIWAIEADLPGGRAITEAVGILAPDSGGWDAQGLDGPCCFKRQGTYYLFYASGSAGYGVGYATASDPLGPWKKSEGNPVLRVPERMRGKQYKMPYSVPPQGPFVTAGHTQVFVGPDGREWLAYHTGEREVEPSLCIDPIEFDEQGRARVTGPTWTSQEVKLP